MPKWVIISRTKPQLSQSAYDNAVILSAEHIISIAGIPWGNIPSITLTEPDGAGWRTTKNFGRLDVCRIRLPNTCTLDDFEWVAA